MKTSFRFIWQKWAFYLATWLVCVSFFFKNNQIKLMISLLCVRTVCPSFFYVEMKGFAMKLFKSNPSTHSVWVKCPTWKCLEHHKAALVPCLLSNLLCTVAWRSGVFDDILHKSTIVITTEQPITTSLVLMCAGTCRYNNEQMLAVAFVPIDLCNIGCAKPNSKTGTSRGLLMNHRCIKTCLLYKCKQGIAHI